MRHILHNTANTRSESRGILSKTLVQSSGRLWHDNEPYPVNGKTCMPKCIHVGLNLMHLIGISNVCT